MNLRSFLILALALAASVPAQAAFHLFRIDEVYTNADGTVQYVVLREMSGTNGENFLAGQMLRATNAQGVTKTFVFSSNLPSSNTANRSVLIATPGFTSLGLVAPDYTMDAGFVPIQGGTLNYAGASPPNVLTLPAMPVDGATAINGNGAQVPATPTNFAGNTATVNVPPPNAGLDLDQHGLTGSWYQPATSGQGIEVEFFPDLVAPGTALVQGAWFTFDVAPSGGADRERWYTFSGSAQRGAANIPITIFQNVGGNFNAPPRTQANSVGSGTLSFNDCTNATLAYTFADGTGRSGSIALSRLLPNVTCALGTSPPTNADFSYSGNWFQDTTSGQGFVFEVNPKTPFFFLTWYTYAPSGQSSGAAGQRWYTGQGAYAPGSRSITVPLFQTTGGVFDQPTTPPPATPAVGNVTVTFTSCTAAQLTFNFTGGTSAGSSGTIPLTRIGPVAPGCTTVSTNNPMPPEYPGYPQ